MELLIDLLDRAVENDGGRCVARNRLDGEGGIDHAILWVGGGQGAGRDLFVSTS